MELFLRKLSLSDKWQIFSKRIRLFYVIYLPLRIIFDLGFINPVAEFFLSFVTLLAPIILFLVFPFARFKIGLKIFFSIGFIFIVLVSFIYIFFRSLYVSDVIRLGYDPSIKVVYESNPSIFQRNVTYESNCGATCDFDFFNVSEIMPIPYVLKFRIPWTIHDLGDRLY
jgi:hypothetical protein